MQVCSLKDNYTLAFKEHLAVELEDISITKKKKTSNSTTLTKMHLNNNQRNPKAIKWIIKTHTVKIITKMDCFSFSKILHKKIIIMRLREGKQAKLGI